MQEQDKTKLNTLIDSIESLEADKEPINNGIKLLYATAKSEGFDIKAIRQVIKLRKLNKEEREEFASIVDLYLNAVS